MSWFDKAISFLFPSMLVEGTPYRSMWEEKEKTSFLALVRAFCLLVAAGYIAHYYFFDKGMGLQPLSFWFTFRMSIAAFALACLAFYVSPLRKLPLYKLPALVLGTVLCYTQGRVLVWYSTDAWMFCFLFAVVSTMVLRMSLLNSLIVGGFFISLEIPSMLQAGLPELYAFSGAFFTIAIVVLTRSSYLSEVKNFILNQENIAAQRKIIELNIEFSDRVRAFIPRVIADRLDAFVNRHHMSVLEASVEVLKPKRQDVACLFSDIRGYTKGSRDLESFVHNSVIPDIKVCSDTVEDHMGIPRKVGDLVFAYFDDEDVTVNVLRAAMAAVDIARVNQDMNATVAQINVRRYILISCGEAIIGNIGGLDSSIEITALGTPVNFLSRLDELTKLTPMASVLEPSDIVLCERSAAMIAAMCSGIRMRRLDINKLGLAVRDFPDTRYVFRMKPTDENYRQLHEPSHAKQTNVNDRTGRQLDISAA